MISIIHFDKIIVVYSAILKGKFVRNQKTKIKKIITTNRVKASTFTVVVLILMLAVFFEITMQVRNNRKKVNESSAILAEQIAEQIHSNSTREEVLSDTHKDSYIVRAQSAAYIIENNDLYIHSVAKLKTVADVIEVDEINIFNEEGVIYAGTQPEYYGTSMDAGDQIRYFKPMLYDKKLSMCQDATYNTVLGKMMMYACVWNEAGTRIYQIGISPTRLINEMEITSVASIIDDIPYRNSMTVMIADAETEEILGSTTDGYVGMNLADFELGGLNVPIEDRCETKAVIDGEASYCVVYNQGDYLITVSQSIYLSNQDIAVSTLIMVAFLVAAILLLLYFINTAVDRVREQETVYLREVEKERASRLETTMNDIMKNALDQHNTLDGIKIVVREVAKELGANACMLYAVDTQIGLGAINVQWKMMPDGTDEFIPVEDAEIPRDTWTWSISTDGNAVIYDTEEIKNISEAAYEDYRKAGTEKAAIISFINQYRAIGFMSISNPNVERMEDIAMVMKQMSKFVISLLKMKAAFDKLTYLGFNDNLTHAFNRRALDDRADKLEMGSTLGILFCDITGLKRMNDEQGHDAGDKLIISAYNALEDEFGATDVYRVGGDEFICVIEDVTSGQFNQIVKDLEFALIQKGVEMSVGSSWTGDYAGDFAYLERRADANMYTKKVEYYKKHPELKREVFERRQSNEMRSMIENLAKAYPLVGTVNLVDGSYRIIKGMDYVVEAASLHTHFDDLVKDVRATSFTRDSAKKLSDTAFVTDIIRLLTDDDSFEYRYQLIDGGWQQMTYQVTERDEDGKPIRTIFYANKVSDALAERLDQDLTTQNGYEMLDGLCYDYSIISIVDKNENRVKVYRYNNFPEKVANAINTMSYTDVVKWYADAYVDESDYDRFLDMCDLDKIDSRLTDRRMSFIFKTKNDFRNVEGGTFARYYFYKTSDEVDTYVFATRDVTENLLLLLGKKES